MTNDNTLYPSISSIKGKTSTNTLEFLSSSAVAQSYDTHVGQEYVIRGNDVLLKCSVPSFVADFVAVLSWQDSEGNSFLANKMGNFVAGLR